MPLTPDCEKDLAIALAVLQGELEHHEADIAQLKRKTYEGNGHDSYDVELARGKQALAALLKRADRQDTWLWGLVASLLVLAIATVLTYWKP